MANFKAKFKSSVSERRVRHFSESLKRKLVSDIESNRCRVIDVCKAHEVAPASVYKWIELYSHKEKPTRTIVESKSETTKILALEKRIAELERALGQKQILIDFKDKMIEIAEQTYKVDIKKKLSSKL